MPVTKATLPTQATAKTTSRLRARPARSPERHAYASDTADCGRDDSDDGAPERPTRRPRRGRQVAFPAEELRQLTPSGVAPLAVARLFFKVRELAEAASFALPDEQNKNNFEYKKYLLRIVTENECSRAVRLHFWLVHGEWRSALVVRRRGTGEAIHRLPLVTQLGQLTRPRQVA
ncbi:hypothetical protein AB1Y20_003828 [Prymnesium parvum]|uniref:Non-specific serine/threonine protein kinase n=1 Tax=Prymnesium parvum TaxID=97485 RepID=A0AB34J854_PRYPA